MQKNALLNIKYDKIILYMSKKKKNQTKISAPGAASIEEAANLIKDGQIVAFPTETVYGLGASCFNKTAIAKIFKAKGRPGDNPLIVHVSSMEQVSDVALAISPTAKELMRHFWPGPLTLVLKKQPSIPEAVTANLDTVAVRMPNHQVAQAIIEHAGVPIAAPSANLSGKPSPTTAQMVYDDLNGEIPLIIDSGPCEVGIESTVLDVTGKVPNILRPGMITIEMINKVIGAVDSVQAGEKEVRSPGVKYEHYKPNADITIVTGPQAAVSRHILFKIHSDEAAGKKSGIICFDQTKRNYSGIVLSLGSRFNLKEVAKNLYSALRKTDELELDTVYAEALSEENEGLAIMNRLLRAANHKVEEI